VNLLVVEDDPAIGEPLRTGLEREGFQVNLVTNGADALAAPAADLVLLDLGLPDLDGREVCRRLRTRSAVPIIVVSARGEEIDRVLLLELGADDYVVKPFGFRELVARIRAVLRRVGGEPDASVTAGCSWARCRSIAAPVRSPTPRPRSRSLQKSLSCWSSWPPTPER
jgi:two-component system response regulator RegX3